MRRFSLDGVRAPESWRGKTRSGSAMRFRMLGLTVSAPIGCDIRCAGAGCRISPAEAHGMAASSDLRPVPRTLPGGVSSGAGVSNTGCGGRVPALVRFAVDRISANGHRSTAARDRSAADKPEALRVSSASEAAFRVF
jgi:hypothetical protein